MIEPVSTKSPFPGFGSDFRKEYLADRVRRHLETAIHDGAFGDVLPGERGLAASYGVSRPVLREAIMKLEEEGILRREQGRLTRILLSR